MFLTWEWSKLLSLGSFLFWSSLYYNWLISKFVRKKLNLFTCNIHYKVLCYNLHILLKHYYIEFYYSLFTIIFIKINSPSSWIIYTDSHRGCELYLFFFFKKKYNIIVKLKHIEICEKINKNFDIQINDFGKFCNSWVLVKKLKEKWLKIKKKDDLIILFIFILIERCDLIESKWLF